MLDFAIFAVTLVVTLVGAIIYLYSVSRHGSLGKLQENLLNDMSLFFGSTYSSVIV